MCCAFTSAIILWTSYLSSTVCTGNVVVVRTHSQHHQSSPLLAATSCGVTLDSSAHRKRLKLMQVWSISLTSQRCRARPVRPVIWRGDPTYTQEYNTQENLFSTLTTLHHQVLTLRLARQTTPAPGAPCVTKCPSAGRV